MRVFRHKRTGTLATVNFDMFQLYVCFLDKKNSVSKWISILPSGGTSWAEIPFLLSDPKTMELASVLRSASSGKLPISFHLKDSFVGGFFGLQFHFSELRNEIVHGKLIPGIYAMGHRVKVKKSSLIQCAEALDSLRDA